MPSKPDVSSSHQFRRFVPEFGSFRLEALTTGFFTSLSRRMAKRLSGDGRSFKPKIG
jgi:hypothetical protein